MERGKNEVEKLLVHGLVVALAALGGGLLAVGCSKAAQFRSGCEAGEALKCYYLGDLYAKGHEVKRDMKQAAVYIEQACQGDVAWACPRIGEMYEKGVGVTADVGKARTYYLKACQGPEDEGCKKAFALFNRLCAENDTAGCDELAGLYEDGVGTPADPERAADLSRKTCSIGSDAGCIRLKSLCDGGHMESCTHLAQLSEQGAGMAQDRGVAVAYYTRACDKAHMPACEGVQRMLGTACKGGDNAACLEVAEMYQLGPEALRSEDKALMFYSDACGGGATKGCERMTSMYEKRCESGSVDICVQLADMYAKGLNNVPKNPNRAVVLYQKGCTDGSMKACTELGTIFLTGEGATKNPARAMELLEHACTNEYAIACGKVAARYREACTGGKLESCYLLGQIMELGKGVMKSEQQSAMLYNKACKGSYMAACAAMGKLYEDGRGLPKDAARALGMYQQACQGGYKAACTEMQRLNGGR